MVAKLFVKDFFVWNTKAVD
uniref:Uncharacterized protein n=1 Tax=Rhizophora mucronata TaxID=61149 RepID=A0A2P2PIL8_RHIMU